MDLQGFIFLKQTILTEPTQHSKTFWHLAWLQISLLLFETKYEDDDDEGEKMEGMKHLNLNAKSVSNVFQTFHKIRSKVWLFADI